MGGAPENDSVKKHGILVKINAKGSRTPTTDCTNGLEICPCLRE
jgi:hypothetical protein